jgi:hypothetical protein
VAKLTGLATQLPEHEQTVILTMAADVGVPAAFLAAIRLAENGRPGREFGVLSEAADTYEAQCRIAALSIRNNTYRFVEKFDRWPIDAATGQLGRSFVDYMASRWAPRGVENDPNDLNAHWPKNVWKYFSESGVI